MKLNFVSQIYYSYKLAFSYTYHTYIQTHLICSMEMIHSIESMLIDSHFVNRIKEIVISRFYQLASTSHTELLTGSNAPAILSAKWAKILLIEIMIDH